MSQLLLFPDPRPLVERLGREFFREAPQRAGIYLMRDAAGRVLYVGKAKNLRKRLASYRVANPDRMRQRHLRLLRTVAQIELQGCFDESEALTREAELLLSLRPPFNRAGTWPGLRRFFTWRVTQSGLDLGVSQAIEPGWCFHGPLGSVAFELRAAVVRLIWSACYPQRGLAGMPGGWYCNRHRGIVTIPSPGVGKLELAEAANHLVATFETGTEAFIEWIRKQVPTQSHPFEIGSRENDLANLCEWARKVREGRMREAATSARHPDLHWSGER